MRRALILLATWLVIVLVTTSAHAANVTLAWNPNTEPDLAGYKIYWGNASRSYTQHVDIPATPGEPKTALIDIQPEDGRSVYFAATAYDKQGNESDYSNEATWSVPDHTAPGNPQNFRLTLELSLHDGELTMRLAEIRRE